MKALFFLRHYNDIDHITPVINKWLNSGHSADVVLLADSALIKDYRIEFLKTRNGCRVTHIKGILGPSLFRRWRLLNLISTGKVRGAVRYLAKLYLSISTAGANNTGWQPLAAKVMDYSFSDGDTGLVAFDWVSRNTALAMRWVDEILLIARERGLGSASLPHGDSPHANAMIRGNELSPLADTSYAAAGVFDRVVVPNALCAERFTPYIKDSEVVVALGSPRYCEEWLEQLGELLPKTPLVRKDGKFNIVMFLRKRNFTSFWEEIGIVARMLANFPNVELIIKEHTRGGWKQPLTWDFNLRRRQNVRLVGGELHSAHLLEWADVVVDLATSVAFESVRHKQPVLAADYLHAGISTLAQYCPETGMNCRDDIFHCIQRLQNEGLDEYYQPENRQRFLDNMLDVQGVDVLPRYIHLLESISA